MYFSIIAILAIISSVYIMKTEKEKLTADVDNTPLRGKLLIYVAILNFFAFPIAQFVFYYGWKKRIPQKAKLASDIGWMYFLAVILYVLYIAYK